MFIIPMYGKIEGRLCFSKKLGIYIRNMTNKEYDFFYKFNVLKQYIIEKRYLKLDGIEDKIYKNFLVIDLDNEKLDSLEGKDFHSKVKKRKEIFEKYGNIINLLLYIEVNCGDYVKMHDALMLDTYLQGDIIKKKIGEINFDYSINLDSFYDFQHIKNSFTELSLFIDIFYFKVSEEINFIGELLTTVIKNDDLKLKYILLITVLEYLIVSDGRKSKNESIRYQLKTKCLSILNTFKYISPNNSLDIKNIGNEFCYFYDIRSAIVHGNSKDKNAIIGKYGRKFLKGVDEKNYFRVSYMSLTSYVGKILLVYLYDYDFINSLKEK